MLTLSTHRFKKGPVRRTVPPATYHNTKKKKEREVKKLGAEFSISSFSSFPFLLTYPSWFRALEQIIKMKAL
jgi:hypothetical protein